MSKIICLKKTVQENLMGEKKSQMAMAEIMI
jgi:hypothetical protein